MRVELASPIDAGDFRSQATTLLAQQVPPADIDWHSEAPVLRGLKFHGNASVDASRLPPSALHSIVPRSFVRLTELVVLHRDESRFELMYRLLWRLVHEPELAGARGDADMAQAQSMAQAVRRDVLRIRKSLRLVPVEPRAGVALARAWCEPQHRVTETVAEWLARQVPVPPWILASRDRCVLWTGRHLLCAPGLEPLTAHAMDDGQWHDLAAGIAEASPPR